MTWLYWNFESPAYLLLLGVLPIVWWMGSKSLSGMSWGRRWFALGARSLLVILVVFAVADIQWVRISDRVATYFLLDQSLSLATEQREASLQYVNAAVRAHRNDAAGDLAGVVVFGSEAQVESPLYSGNVLSHHVESTIAPERTSLASAMRLANATFPDGVAKRVVIVSDGNQNLGDAVSEAQSLVSGGVGIDVAPVDLRQQADILVEKITAPPVARAGVPFDVMVVVRNTSATPDAAGSVRGRMQVLRKAGDDEQLVGEQTVDLPPGKHVFSFRQELAAPAFYTYEARFVAESPGRDRFAQNNRATAFTQLQGKGRVLFIVNAESPNEFDKLIERLRATEIEVTVQTTAALFTRLADLQPYDCVVMANVPQTSGDSADTLAQFSEEQVATLVKNVEQLGAGLIMLGGPDSFGAGGWANSKLEEAMPVDFRVKNSQVVAVGALMLVVDRSGSMDGEKLMMSKVAAKAAVQMLGAHDQVGIISFDSAPTDVVRLTKVGENRKRIYDRISRIASGGGTDLEPAMRRGYESLRKSTASVKHMIVLTDGQTQGSGFTQMASTMQKQGITTTTVAVGSNAARGLLQDIANKGQGKYYQVTNPKVIPRIFARETRRVVRPLIFEEPAGFRPQIVEQHEVLQGVGETLPPITGFILTTPKENPLVEVPILSPRPDKQSNPILAMWNYGLGRTAVFTTDGGHRWAQAWTDWEQYDRLFVQLVRWSMRPPVDQEAFTATADVTDGKLRVVVNSLNSQGEFLNNLNMQGALVGDASEDGGELRFQQVAPGRYVAEMALEKAGSYMLAVQPGKGHGAIRLGVNVPFSSEFKDATANEALLISLSQMTPAGGKPGEILRLPEDTSLWSQWQGPDIFRRDLPPGRRLTSIWPLVALTAACLFLLDIANRRLLITGEGLAWLWPFGSRQKQVETPRRLAPVAVAPRLGADIEPSAEVPLQQQLPAAPAAVQEPEPAEDSYAQRLLKVKRGAQKRPPGALQ